MEHKKPFLFQLQLFILALVVVASRAGVAPVVAPVAAPLAAPVAVAKLVDSEFDPNPQYSFAYDVQDTLTGDSKSQIESRNGNVVQGQYTVVDPDGTRRVVDYTADPVNGFNAVVSKTPVVRAVAAAPVVAPAAPVVAPAAPVVAPAARLVAAPAAPVVAAPAPLVAAPAPARFAAPFAYPAPALPAYASYPGIARLAAPYTYAAY